MSVTGDRLIVKCAGESLFFEDFMGKYEIMELEKKELKERQLAKHFSTDSLEKFHVMDDKPRA
jgi:hypothetical protein